MLFTEFSFIFIFLPITLAVYYLLPEGRQRLVAIILASIVFYSAWNIYFLPMLLFAIISNYLIAVRLHATRSRAWFLVGLAVALTPIIYFKYSGLFVHSAGIDIETGFFGEKLGSLLPLGISFYTFQQITYLSDVSARRIEPGGFIEYAFFKLFFPQLIAGPILHYNQLVPQIGQPVDRERLFLEGIVYFTIGFIKKFFLADGFAAFSDPVYDGTDAVTTQAALVATLGYTFQLYFDFSGYSDMALGLARMFGFKLPWNFDSPYKAGSISDFWRRWHMTLSRFLRDYVYIPLGGNRRGDISRYRNLLLTMLVGGLWHGAAWTFVVWGGLHGVALAVNHLWDRFVRIRLWGLGWLLTFVLVALLWVLFRATSFERAIEIYLALLRMEPLDADRFWWWAATGAAIAFLLPNSHRIVEFMSRAARIPASFSVARAAPRFGVYAAMASVVLYGVTFAYYTTPMDRAVYPLLNVSTPASSIDSYNGDLRNNLWRKDLFARTEPRIAFVGSSFVGHLGALDVRQEGRTVAVSQTLSVAGNGLMNAARVGSSVSAAHMASVVVAGVSPLNFGEQIFSFTFPGQCLQSLAPYLGEYNERLPHAVNMDCLPDSPAPLSYLSVFAADRTNSTMQFKDFVQGVALGFTGTRNPFETFDADRAAEDLLRIREDFEEWAAHGGQVFDPKNGSDETFDWWNRGVVPSLSPGGSSYEVLRAMKEEARKAGNVFVMYETPTSLHHSAPHVYPEGFFEAYQEALGAAARDLGIPYLDLSDLLPWTEMLMSDFIHPHPRASALIHRIVLAWLFQPEALRGSGLIDPAKVPDIAGLREALQ